MDGGRAKSYDDPLFKELNGIWGLAIKSFTRAELAGDISVVFKNLVSIGGGAPEIAAFKKYYEGDARKSDDQYTVKPRNFFKEKYKEYLPAMRDDGSVITKREEKEASVDKHLFSEIDRYIETSQWSRTCLLYTSPSPRDQRGSRMPSSA